MAANRTDPGRRLLVGVVIGAAIALASPPLRAQEIYEDFVIAVANDRVTEVRALLERGMDPDTVDPNGDPVLLLAARSGNAATVDLLLASRAKVNIRNKYGDSPLMVAALNGYLGIVKNLRARGAEVNGPGWTALIFAATGGHDDIVRYLLAEGADVNAASPNGTTALMMAARESRNSTVELLLARGANAAGRNQGGMGALDFAKRNGDEPMAGRLRSAGARD
jgi:uncharacterized protein